MNTLGLTLAYLGVAVFSYLLGSVNSAVIVTRLYAKTDIRNYGSGNAGMTNVWRTFGPFPAVLTLLGDFLKGVIASALARLILGACFTQLPFDPAYVASVFALLGHVYPLYFGFRGGKGMATTAGILLVIDPLMCGIILFIFLVIVLITRIVSLGSILSALLYPFLTYFVLTAQGKPAMQECIFTAILAAFLIFMHRSNIKRLFHGTENRFSFKKKK